MDRIDDNLFVGDWQDAQEYAPEYFTISLTKESPGGEHLHYPIRDDSQNTKFRLLGFIQLAMTVSSFRDAGFDRTIFVHCAAGQSRSVLFSSLVLLYSHKNNLDTFGDVAEYIVEQYPGANPSPQLKTQIKKIVLDNG